MNDAEEHPKWPDGSPMLCGQVVQVVSEGGWRAWISRIHAEEITVVELGDEEPYEVAPSELAPVLMSGEPR